VTLSGVDRTKKLLVVGIIVLFVGVGIQSAFAVESRVSNDTIEKEEDCDCQEIDKINPVRVKLLFNQLKVVSNILLKKFGHNPEVKEQCQKLLELIKSNRKSYEPPFPIFCSILENITISVWETAQNIYDIIDIYTDEGLFLKALLLIITLGPIAMFLEIYVTFFLMGIGILFCQWTI
jgi:hypothetical protein